MRKKLTIRQRVRVYLAERDMTQGALAAKWGMTEARLSDILAGKAFPTIPQLAEMEKTLGITARDFAQQEVA